MNVLIFNDITAPYYLEAKEASTLFEDYAILPSSPYKKMMKMLFKSCRKELKLFLRLHLTAVRKEYASGVRLLRQTSMTKSSNGDLAAASEKVSAEQLPQLLQEQSSGKTDSSLE